MILSWVLLQEIDGEQCEGCEAYVDELYCYTGGIRALCEQVLRDDGGKSLDAAHS